VQTLEQTASDAGVKPVDIKATESQTIAFESSQFQRKRLAVI
jgi:hypothetical protein